MLRHKHPLHIEFPQFTCDINRLKSSDTHFRKLFDEFNFLTHELEKMAQKSITFSTMTEQRFKKHRRQLRDTLFGYLKKEASLSRCDAVA